MLESRNESSSGKLIMVTVEPSFQAEDSPVDRRHPAMCVAVALNPFHTCPALPPSHRIPSRWPPARRTPPGEEVDKKCCHSSRPNPSQRCSSGGGATGFRAGMHRRAERKDEEERSARAAASNGALAPESPFGRTAARERGEEYVHQGARRRVAGRVRAHR